MRASPSASMPGAPRCRPRSPRPRMAEPLAPGSVVGIIGGGQLGRMLSVAASRLGLRAHIYDPADAPPAGDVASSVSRGGWDDTAALSAFARAVDVVTYEFENVPADSLEAIEAATPVFPPREALAISQDRLAEKNFLTRLGLATAPYAAVTTRSDLELALSTIGAPAILKTRRLGHDGTTMAFEPGENVHEAGILRRTTVPAPISDATRREALEIAAAILVALDYVGVIGVELFETDAGLLVNEFAPRVHNSGHWTMDGGTPCQFEAHIRAIAGWPLPAPVRTADVTMENLIGHDVDRVPALAASPGVAVHLYGKAEVREGRKMGHVNRVRAR